MNDYSQLVPEHVRNLGGYTPGKSLRQAQRESRVNCIKMASNENPFGPSPMAVKAMQSIISESNFYPDNDAGELRRRQPYAEQHQRPPREGDGIGDAALDDVTDLRRRGLHVGAPELGDEIRHGGVRRANLHALDVIGHQHLF